MSSSRLPIVVIGAGPVGLAAAAHLVERGETPLVLEAGPVLIAKKSMKLQPLSCSGRSSSRTLGR